MDFSDFQLVLLLPLWKICTALDLLAILFVILIAWHCIAYIVLMCLLETAHSLTRFAGIDHYELKGNLITVLKPYTI